MLMREPELGLNTENKRLPRGGRQLSFAASPIAVAVDVVAVEKKYW